MKASVLLDKLSRAPFYADVLAKTADGRWLKIEAVEFTYNPADPAMTTPSNVCLSGSDVPKPPRARTAG